MNKLSTLIWASNVYKAHYKRTGKSGTGLSLGDRTERCPPLVLEFRVIFWPVLKPYAFACITFLALFDLGEFVILYGPVYLS
jgi:hypothetical protein